MPRSEANPSDRHEEETAGRLDRLATAMELFLQLRNSGAEERAAMLQQHADLADLLEPMFADLDDKVGEAASRTDEPDDGIDTGTDSAMPAPLQPGHQIGDYRIVREAGHGGMGTVFEAQQISLDRRVALKVLHPHLSWSAASITRFRNEAAAAARLQHPAIVPIYEVGEWHGLHFFSMEFVDGQPLNEILHKDRLGIRKDCTRAVEAAELVAQIADALQHAHGHSLIHRDVKPQNIMLTNDGQVRLLDFGLVKHFDADSNTAHGTFFGTPHYCSPEQAQHSLDVEPRTDVFSLAIVLYELVTRHRPFEGATTRLILQHIESGAFRPLRQVAPAVPRDLETICHKALEVDPDARYASAGDFANDLRRFLRIEPIKAKPPGRMVRGLKWARRNRARVALGSALFVIAVGGPASYMWMQHQALVTANRERQILDKSEDLGFRSIEQTLTLLNLQLERSPTPPVDGHERVDEVVNVCEEFLNLRSQSENRRLRVAAALDSTSNIYRQLGKLEAAQAACTRAIDIVATTTPSPPHQRLRGRLLLRQFQLQQLLIPTRTDKAFAEALDHLKPLCLATDADLRTRIIYSETLRTRAQNFNNFERYAEARQLLLQAIEILPANELASSTDVAQSRATMCRLRARISLGIALLRMGKANEALEQLQPTLLLLQQQPKNAATSLQKTLATAAIGLAQQSLGQRGAAERSLREAIDSGDGQLQEFPGAHLLRHTWMRCRVRLSNILLGKRQFEEAEQVVRTAYATTQTTRKETPHDRYLCAQVASQLAACVLMRGQDGATNEATDLLTASCELKEQLILEHPEMWRYRRELGGDLNNLAAINNQRGDPAAASQLARKAIAQQQHVLIAKPQDRRAKLFLGMHNSQLALACASQAQHEAAIAAATAVLEHTPKHLDSLRIAAMAANRCADTARNDTTSLHERDASERYAVFAVQTLKQLVKCNRGFAARVLAQTAFDSLRDREDFQSLLTSTNR